MNEKKKHRKAAESRWLIKNITSFSIHLFTLRYSTSSPPFVSQLARLQRRVLLLRNNYREQLAFSASQNSPAHPYVVAPHVSVPFNSEQWLWVNCNLICTHYNLSKWEQEGSEWNVIKETKDNLESNNKKKESVDDTMITKEEEDWRKDWAWSHLCIFFCRLPLGA